MSLLKEVRPTKLQTSPKEYQHTNFLLKNTIRKIFLKTHAKSSVLEILATESQVILCIYSFFNTCGMIRKITLIDDDIH